MGRRDTRAAIETPGETMTETVSLKALARLILERDSARDSRRDRVSHMDAPPPQGRRDSLCRFVLLLLIRLRLSPSRGRAI